MIRKKWFLLFLIFTVFPAPGIASEKPHASVFVYFQVGNDESVRDDTLSLEKFKSHLTVIRARHFNVMPLPDIMQALSTGAALPDKAIALTFDNPSRATLRTVEPLLKAAQLPFTVFTTTDNPDYPGSDNVTWDDLKRLQENRLATIGLMGQTYQSLLRLNAEQRRIAYNYAFSRFESQLGKRPEFFAYPYGDYDSEIARELQARGISGALGSQSGVAASGNLFSLPRFSMTERYGDEERFTMAAKALPLQVNEVTPPSPLITQNPPLAGFTLHDERIKPEQVKCHSSAPGGLNPSILDRRIELRFQETLPPGRYRLNCISTVKDENDEQRLLWWGMMLVVPR